MENIKKESERNISLTGKENISINVGSGKHSTHKDYQPNSAEDEALSFLEGNSSKFSFIIKLQTILKVLIIFSVFFAAYDVLQKQSTGRPTFEVILLTFLFTTYTTLEIMSSGLISSINSNLLKSINRKDE